MAILFIFLMSIRIVAMPYFQTWDGNIWGIQLEILNSQILLNLLGIKTCPLLLVRKLTPSHTFVWRSHRGSRWGRFLQRQCLSPLRIDPHLLLATWPITRMKSQKTNGKCDGPANKIVEWSSKKLLECQEALNDSMLKKKSYLFPHMMRGATATLLLFSC